MTTEQIVDAVIGREGKYTNNADDLGGETMWGITKAAAREHGYIGKMVEMPRTVAVAIYTKTYVNEPGFNRIAVVSEKIAEEMVDSGVNVGTSWPGPWLQRTLNVLNMRGTLYPDIAVDGQIGPSTISALKSLLAKRGKEGELVALRTLNCLQGARYLEITEKREANETFFYGWMKNRVEI